MKFTGNVGMDWYLQQQAKRKENHRIEDERRKKALAEIKKKRLIKSK